MSETFQITESWPSTIPLPYVDYSGSPRNATLVSSLESGNILRRKRFQKSYTGVAVVWILADTEYALFKTFFESTIDVGAALFKMDLRFPQNSALQEWAVRFVEGYDAAHIDGNWRISANLDLINLTTLPDGAPQLGAVEFQVIYEGVPPPNYVGVDTNDTYHLYVQP